MMKNKLMLFALLTGSYVFTKKHDAIQDCFPNASSIQIFNNASDPNKPLKHVIDAYTLQRTYFTIKRHFQKEPKHNAESVIIFPNNQNAEILSIIISNKDDKNNESFTIFYEQ
ncbi:MAG: hypothetical protein WC747_01725 [Candidatus Babeliales bacterium]